MPTPYASRATARFEGDHILALDDELERPFYHPVLEEGLRTALRSLNHTLGMGGNRRLVVLAVVPAGKGRSVIRCR